MFYTAISGLNAFRQQLAVISDNIANSQTTAFKAGGVSFAEVLSGSTSSSVSGDVGNGVAIRNISVGWTQGTISNTGNANDYSITGSGFFVVRDADGLTNYTRDGQFLYNTAGSLVNGDGMTVQGYAIDTAGNVSTGYSDITIPTGDIQATATTAITATVNLDAGAVAGDTFSATVNTYDSLGESTPLTINFAKVAPTVNSFTLDLFANSLAAGDTVTIGGQEYTAINSYSDIKVDLTDIAVGEHIVVGGVSYVAVLGATALLTAFDCTSGNTAAADLTTKIPLRQSGIYDTLAAAGTVLTIIADGSTVLNTDSVTEDAADTSVTVTPTAVTLSDGDFAISDNATADATSLQAAIAAHQIIAGSDYGITRTTDTIIITPGTVSSLDAGTLVVGATAVNDIALTSDLSNTRRWSWAAEIPTATGAAAGSGILDFTATGQLVAPAGSDPTIAITALASGADDMVVTWDLYNDLGTATNGDLTQYAAANSSLSGTWQDGIPSGKLKSLSTDKNGIITAGYSNGMTRSLYQVALADFNNYDGLNKTGNNLYSETTASGTPIPGAAGVGKFGTMSPGSLETSNVDMAKEMASMILAQRSYESCARMFTTESEMLQTTVNMGK